MDQPDSAQSKPSAGSLTIRGECQYLSLIRKAVTDLANTVGFSSDDIAAIEMAVGEAAENILEHAYAQPSREWQSQCDPEIHLNIRVEDSRLIVELTDHGQKFDFTNYRPPHSHDSVSAGRTGGYGIFIMREFMDEVQYTSSDETGNTLRLVKYLKKS